MKNDSVGLLVVLFIILLLAYLLAKVYFMFLYRFSAEWTIFVQVMRQGRVNTLNVIFMFTHLSMCQTQACTKIIFLTKAFLTICRQHRFFAALTRECYHVVYKRKKACGEWVRKQQTFVYLADDKSKHEN